MFNNDQSPPQDYEYIPQSLGVPVSQTINEIKNIVSQINPDKIIQELNNVLEGKYKDGEIWKMNPTGLPLVNEACRAYCVAFLCGVLNNNTTMGNIDEKRLGLLMEAVIGTITKNFTTRLEEFGFVPPGRTYKEKIYENKGTPDSARMDLVANLIYIASFIVFTRPLKGQESIRIFKSLSMVDNFSGGQHQQQQKKTWLNKLMGG